MTTVVVTIAQGNNSTGPYGPTGGTGTGWWNSAGMGGSTGPVGAIVSVPDPPILNSATLTAIAESSGGVFPGFTVAVAGTFPQNFFTSVAFGANTLLTNAATWTQFTSAGVPYTRWIWAATGIGASTAFTFTYTSVPLVSLDVPTVVGATDVLLTWAPFNLSALTVVSYDVYRAGVFVANVDPDVLTFADQVDTPSTTFTYQIRMHLSDASTVLSNTQTATTGDATAEFNCDCETVSSYATLLELRIRMAIQCGFAATALNLPAGQATEFNEYLYSAQRQLYLKFRAQRTERFFRWTMTPGLRYYGLTAAEGSCTLQLNPLAITWVGFEDLNKAWYRLVEGIDPVYYTRANINFGWPTRYEIRSCIEVFPAPQAVYTLWIKGDIGLAPFSADADRTTFDDEAVLLFAVGNWKSAKGRSDWERAMGQATARLQDLTARKHGTARYVPSTYVQNPATPPRFLPLGSQQA